MKRSRMPEDPKVSLHPYSMEASQVPQLPLLSIDTMTQGQLRDFIPHLLKLVHVRTTDLAEKGAKPNWWPSDIPWSATKTDCSKQEATWTETLRNLVKSCYKHMGQESSLRSKAQAKTRGTQNLQVLQAYLQHSARARPGKKTNNKPFAEIYICFFCEQEFLDRDEMRYHQEKCVERPPTLQAVSTPPKQLQSPGGPPPISPSPKLSLMDKGMRPTKDMVIKLLGLVPKQKAEKIRAKHRYSQDIDCERIDLDEPMSPTTPRTPKSLISQLSRDDTIGTSKKRLCYSDNDDNNDRESVASGSDDSEGAGQKGKSLLSIDLSSLLGQRIQKHMHSESGLLVIPNAEQFCKTPVKNDFLGKLRHRVVTFPITYRPRKKSVEKFTHEYKFNSRQKSEYMRQVKSGLCKSSYKLLKSLPKATIVLDRLTDKELKQWLSKFTYRKWKGIKTVESVVQESVFPTLPLLMSKEVDRLLGLKRRSGYNSSIPLSLANVVSEHTNAEASKQKFTLYRCLLSDIASYSATHGGKGVPNLKREQAISNKVTAAGETGWQSSLKSAWKDQGSKSGKGFILPATPNTASAGNIQGPTSLDLPIFPKSRSDDDISIVSMSSDEESLKSTCCTGCRQRKHCRCTPDPVFRSPSLSPVSPPLISDGKSKPAKGATLPVNVPLQINPYASTLKTPEISPCSCLSSPESDLDINQKIFPSPASSTKSCSPLIVGSSGLSVKGIPSPSKGSGSTRSEIRKTRSTSAFIEHLSNRNVNKLENLLTSNKTEDVSLLVPRSQMSLRNNKSVSSQEPVISLSPSPSPSPLHFKENNGYTSPTKDISSESVDTLSLSAQRRILRASRQESPSVPLCSQGESPKKLNMPTLRILLKNSTMCPIKNTVLTLGESSPVKSSPSKSLEPPRRSKRILSASSPAGSPAKLRKLETC